MDPQRFQMIQAQMQAAERRLGTLEANVMELQQAITTLEAMEQGQTDGPVLLPIGGGIQVRASLDKETQVMRSIGAETYVDGTVAQAISAAKERRDKLGQAYEETAGKLNELARMAEAAQQGAPTA